MIARLLGSSTVLLVFAFACHAAFGRADPPEWSAAKKLLDEATAAGSPLAEAERNKYVAIYEQIETQRAQLESAEKEAISRLAAYPKKTSEYQAELAAHERKRLAWQSRLETYNSQCNRTFTNPADVARCDASADALAAEQKALDDESAQLAAYAARLDLEQKKDIAEAGQVDRRYAEWRHAVEVNFNEPLRVALAGKPTVLRVTAKSFIKVIDLSSLSAESRPRAEQAFAWLTNRNFSENPVTPSPNGRDFRLWSQVTVVASCRGNRVRSWKASNLAHRGGTELRILDAETSILQPLRVMAEGAEPEGAHALAVSYAISGKPHDFALPSFRAVKPRSCDRIWHVVKAKLTCRDGRAEMQAEVSGSRFPSHRVWVNDDIRGSVAQDRFAALWECDAAVPGLVR